MAHQVFDRVRETSTSTGTGAITLAGTVAGFRTFASTLAVSDTTWYAIVAADGTWEVGLGTLTASTTLARTTVLASSNANALVNFATGGKDVFVDAPAVLIQQLSEHVLPEATMASAATINLGASNPRDVVITGTTTITSLGTMANRERIVRFAGSLTLTHNATSLILPTGQNIVTQAGDTALFTSDASGNWRCNHYQRANGQPLANVPNDPQYTQKRNRCWDPGFQVSQESGTSASTVTFYPTDSVQYAVSFTAGAAQCQRVAVATPGGAQYRLRTTINSVNTSPGAGDYAILIHRIEGLDVADLGLGTAGVKQIPLRFGYRASVAGTYCLSIRNSANNRSLAGEFTVSAGQLNTDQVFSIVLTGDNTGTWATDTTPGLIMSICLVAGSTFKTATAWTWQAGNYFATNSQVNMAATASAYFDLFDIGLYDGSVLPPFAIPAYDESLAKCQRYYSTAYGNIYAVASGAQQWENALYLPRAMRSTPTASLASGAGRSNVASLTVSPQGTAYARFTMVTAASGAAYAINDLWNFNARM